MSSVLRLGEGVRDIPGGLVGGYLMGGYPKVKQYSGCRRLHRGYDRRADYFASFVAALICYRRLTK